MKHAKEEEGRGAWGERALTAATGPAAAGSARLASLAGLVAAPRERPLELTVPTTGTLSTGETPLGLVREPDTRAAAAPLVPAPAAATAGDVNIMSAPVLLRRMRIWPFFHRDRSRS